ENDPFVDAMAGVGDVVTLGVSAKLRGWIGAGAFVNPCSDDYHRGTVGGDAINTVMVVADVASAAAIGRNALLGEGTAGGGKALYRYRNGPETATRLGRQAADAEANGFPHGVSTTTNPIPGRPCASALCSDVENVFRVVKTGRDPYHYTVELPNPV